MSLLFASCADDYVEKGLALWWPYMGGNFDRKGMSKIDVGL